MAGEQIALDVGDVGRDNSHEEEDADLRYMKKTLNRLANASVVRSECMIHKVDYEERQKNIKEHRKDEDNPYDPRVISIGPLHRGNPELKKMEDVKWRYLKNLLDNNEGDLAAYLDAVRSKEAEATTCYWSKEFKNIDGDDTFSTMLVLDGCFIIEFLRKSRYPRSVPEQEKDEDEQEKDEDVLNDFGWRLSWIKHDILLLENQLPFSVLDALFEVVFPKGFSSKRRNIKIKMLDLSIDYLYYTELWDQHRNFWAFYADQSLPEIDNLGPSHLRPSHLLHLYHTIIVEFQHTPPFSIIQKIRGAIKFVLSSILSIVYWPMFFFHILFFANSALYPTKISTATELQEAGVRFQGSFMDLRFNKGTLFIPIFSLNYHSFSLLKNLIALEFYHPKILPYVYCYAEFLTELIRSSDDLEIMENHHIIMAQNKEIGTRLISKLFLESELGETMMRLGKKFGYWQHPLERQKEMIKYCEQPRHRWRKKLMKDYFDSPWSILGLLVGLMLLVLTTLQTIFTMVPYYHPRP